MVSGRLQLRPNIGLNNARPSQISQSLPSKALAGARQETGSLFRIGRQARCSLLSCMHENLEAPSRTAEDWGFTAFLGRMFRTVVDYVAGAATSRRAGASN
jgi:hypothetical protein